MTATALLERKEGLARNGQPRHLSYSRINRYLTCPEQYRLYYIENLRPRVPSASLIFGQCIHQALAHHFQTGGDPIAFFRVLWTKVKDQRLTFSAKETWEKLMERGQLLLEKFMREEFPKLGRVTASERPFELAVTSLDLPFVGVIDLVTELEAKKTVVDFKTAGAAYEDHEVALSDQLTGYQLAEPDTEQAALCVLIKTKEPRIEWYYSRRTGDQLVEFLRKVGMIGTDISQGRFYRRPGKHCSWCDFLPVCLGDKERIKASLVKVV